MIEAIIGLVGVIVGSLVVVAKETVSSHLERKRNASYAAMRIVSKLDQFVETCVDIIYDDGTVMGQLAGRTKNGEEYAIAQIQPPSDLAFSDDIDWKSIGGEFMYRVLALPNKLGQANRHVDFWGRNASYPHLDEYFEARQECYSELGLEALHLADDLRTRFEIPPRRNPTWKSDWDPKAFFQETKSKYEDRSKADTSPISNESKEIVE